MDARIRLERGHRIIFLFAVRRTADRMAISLHFPGGSGGLPPIRSPWLRHNLIRTAICLKATRVSSRINARVSSVAERFPGSSCVGRQVGVYRERGQRQQQSALEKEGGEGETIIVLKCTAHKYRKIAILLWIIVTATSTIDSLQPSFTSHRRLDMRPNLTAPAHGSHRSAFRVMASIRCVCVCVWGTGGGGMPASPIQNNGRLT